MRPAASHAYTVAEETICEPSVGGLTPRRPPARGGVRFGGHGGRTEKRGLRTSLAEGRC